MGSFSAYTLLIAKMNPEFLNDSQFNSKLFDSFWKNIPYGLQRRIKNYSEPKQVLEDYRERYNLSRSGKNTMNNMECFDDQFFAEHGGIIISLLEKFLQ